MCKFVAQMAGEGLRHRTIKSYMAGVRHLLIQEGLGYPLSPHLPVVMTMTRFTASNLANPVKQAEVCWQIQ